MGCAGLPGLFPVISSGQPFFYENIENDKQISAPHFPDFQLGDACLAVSPTDGNRLIGVASDDGFQGELNGHVEVMGEQWHAPVDDMLPVGFECIGDVIMPQPEEDLNKEIGEPVQNQFVHRITDQSASFEKTGSEDAVVALR